MRRCGNRNKKYSTCTERGPFQTSSCAWMNLTNGFWMRLLTRFALAAFSNVILTLKCTSLDYLWALLLKWVLVVCKQHGFASKARGASKTRHWTSKIAAWPDELIYLIPWVKISPRQISQVWRWNIAKNSNFHISKKYNHTFKKSFSSDVILREKIGLHSPSAARDSLNPFFLKRRNFLACSMINVRVMSRQK